MLRAIRQGEIDALVVEGDGGSQVYTLHSAEEPYRHLVEQMQEGAVVLTGRGDILYANARFAAMVGEPLESVVGSRIDRFVEASDRDEFEALLRAGSGRRRGRLVGADSGAFEVSLSLTTTGVGKRRSPESDRRRISASSSKPTATATAPSTTAARRTSSWRCWPTSCARRSARSAAAVRVLELTHAGEQPASRAYDVIARQVGHITHLIDDLLDVERVVSGKIRLNRQPLDMAAAVRQAVATFTGDALLDRRIDVSTEPVWVEWDAERLEQVLTNIVTNAVKYTPPGGGFAWRFAPTAATPC